MTEMMRRWAFNLATAVSLVLCVGTVVLLFFGASSPWRYAYFTYQTGGGADAKEHGNCAGLLIADGVVQFGLVPLWMMPQNWPEITATHGGAQFGAFDAGGD